jgi:hypothetical protein
MRRLRIVATWIASAVMLSACGAPSVSADMQRIITNILFGVPTAAKPKPQPSIPPLVPPIPYAPQAFGFPPLTPIANPCPQPPPGTPADAPAATSVSGAAKVGARRWQGVYRATDSSNVTNYRSGFEERYFLNAKNDGTVVDPFTSEPVYKYEYTEIQPDYMEAGAHDQVTYVIQTNSPINQNAATYNGNQDPNAGITITDFLRLRDKDDSKIEEFKPSNNGLLIFPQPFVASSFGQYYWDFTASDPVDGWTEQIFGLATNQRKLVNACGSVVEGWPTDAYIIVHKKDPATGVAEAPIEDYWSYVVAPQYGGLIVQRSLCEGPANPTDVATMQAWSYGAEGFLGLGAPTVPGPAAPTFSGPIACNYATQENIASTQLLPLPPGVG